MPRKKQPTTSEPPPSVASISMPSVERIQQELGSAKSLDDFFGKEGIFARLFADTVEQMLEAELTAHLGYPPHASEGRNSGNSRNGKRMRKLRTSSGDTSIQVPRPIHNGRMGLNSTASTMSATCIGCIEGPQLLQQR